MQAKIWAEQEFERLKKKHKAFALKVAVKKRLEFEKVAKVAALVLIEALRAHPEAVEYESYEASPTNIVPDEETLERIAHSEQFQDNEDDRFIN